MDLASSHELVPAAQKRPIMPEGHNTNALLDHEERVPWLPNNNGKIRQILLKAFTNTLV